MCHGDRWLAAHRSRITYLQAESFPVMDLPQNSSVNLKKTKKRPFESLKSILTTSHMGQSRNPPLCEEAIITMDWKYKIMKIIYIDI